MFADDMSAQIVSLSNILKLAFSKLDSVGDLVAPLKSLARNMQSMVLLRIIMGLLQQH